MVKKETIEEEEQEEDQEEAEEEEQEKPKRKYKKRKLPTNRKGIQWKKKYIEIEKERDELLGRLAEEEAEIEDEEEQEEEQEEEENTCPFCNYNKIKNLARHCENCGHILEWGE